MSTIITIPLLDIDISVNTLISTILLLCIFFTFFSVTFELGGNLSLQSVVDEESSCNQDGTPQVANFTTKWKHGITNMFTEMENTMGGNASTGTTATSSSST